MAKEEGIIVEYATGPIFVISLKRKKMEIPKKLMIKS